MIPSSSSSRCRSDLVCCLSRAVVIRNNIIEAVNEDPHVNGGAISIRAYTLGPDGKTYPSEAMSGFRNISVTNNTIIQTDRALWSAVHVGSSDDVTVDENHFVLRPGFNASVPLVAVCNSRNVTLLGNRVTGAPAGYLSGVSVIHCMQPGAVATRIIKI